MSNLKKTKSTLKKQTALNAVATPAFQNRRTVADHVRDNMLCAGRRSYFQRIIYIGKHKKEDVNIKDVYNNIINDVNKNAPGELLSGLFLNYVGYSIHMIEGTEEEIGKYLKKLTEKYSTILEKSKIVLVYNNANQQFFRKVITKLAEPRIVLDQITGNSHEIILFNTKELIRMVYTICKNIRDEELNDGGGFRTGYLSNTYSRILPAISLLDFILDSSGLQSIPEYSKMFCEIPENSNYSESVWPVPFDFTPNNIFDWGPYDINLTFGNKKK